MLTSKHGSKLRRVDLQIFFHRLSKTIFSRVFFIMSQAVKVTNFEKVWRMRETDSKIFDDFTSLFFGEIPELNDSREWPY